jgi:hypothetical protein
MLTNLEDEKLVLSGKIKRFGDSFEFHGVGYSDNKMIIAISKNQYTGLFCAKISDLNGSKLGMVNFKPTTNGNLDVVNLFIHYN